jgi:hypothetical protein
MLETLFIITSDPRRTHRPAEAIRIAAGVSAWKKVAANLYFRGPAVLCLSEFPDELVQGANIERYLPTAAEGGHLLAQDSAPELNELGQPALKFARITDAQLASLATRMRYVLHF